MKLNFVPTCECGCGTHVNWDSKNKCWYRFLNGHNSKIRNPMLGVHRYGEDAPFFGLRHSETTKKKMSNNHADFSGDNNPNSKKL